MSNIYDKILQRMIEYRNSLDLTQEQVGAILGKTQSQFSKIELGKTIISYDDLCLLLQADWDIDYLVTAKPQITWKKSVEDCFHVEKQHWNELKEVLIWAIGQVIPDSRGIENKDIFCEYALLKRMVNHQKSDSLLLELRSISGIAQTAMAEQLGVNIKKYRDLERRVTNPDAELLALIYEMTSCRPSLFFYQDEMEEHILNDLWNQISEERQKKIILFVEYAARMRGI